MRTLKLALASSDDELKQLYLNQIEKHNQQVLSEPNAGFDLFVPQDTVVSGLKSTMISMNVKCEMVDSDSANRCVSYFMFARSSISKTPLMLANHVGIIDSGYRGNLIGAFRNLSDNDFLVEKHTRLLQVCSGDLSPFFVDLVDVYELSNTDRGEGGFGSTGK
jgi:dUTP pyrophosphatase